MQCAPGDEKHYLLLQKAPAEHLKSGDDNAIHCFNERIKCLLRFCCLGFFNNTNIIPSLCP